MYIYKIQLKSIVCVCRLCVCNKQQITGENKRHYIALLCVYVGTRVRVYVKSNNNIEINLIILPSL